MTAAVIPARGGSIRIPRKNLKDFCGLPLVAWAIIQAQASHLIDRVFVSTDDDEIEEVSREYGAEIIRRPDWADADTASGGRPICHAAKVTLDMDVVVAMFATMPCRYPDDIDRTIRQFNELEDVDYLCPFAYHREHYLYNLRTPGYISRVWTTRRPQYYDHAAGMSVATREWQLTNNTNQSSTESDEEFWDRCFGTDMGAQAFIEFKPFQTADCDTLDEWEFSQVVMEHYILKGRGRAVYDDYGRTE